MRAVAVAIGFVLLSVAPVRVADQSARAERWVGTWYAASTARVDAAPVPAQTPVTVPAVTPVPPAVVAVAQRNWGEGNDHLRFVHMVLLEPYWNIHQGL